jgi:hypothetical protein
MYRAVANDLDFEFAKRNVESAETALIARRKHDEETLAAELRRKAELKVSLAEAMRAARFLCQSRDECQKAFSLTQIFVSEKADMKLQVTTDTIIETFNATELMRISLKAVKIPGAGSSAEIVLNGSCKDDGSQLAVERCATRMLELYRAYPTFMRTSFRP